MEFFNSQRRRVQLKDWSPKHNTENEKRILLNFVLKFTGENITGIPDFANDAFVAIEKQKTAIEEIKLDTEIEGVTLEIYDTPEAKRRALLITAATLRKFTMTRQGDETVMTFNTTIPRPIELLEFAHKYENAEMFILFDATQAKLIFTGEDENQTKLFGETKTDDEEDGEDDEEAEVEKVAKNFGVNQRRIAREMPAGKAAKGKK